MEKQITIRIVAEIDIPKFAISDSDQLAAKSLIGEWVKIKSGEFENLAMGVVLEAEIIDAENTEGR